MGVEVVQVVEVRLLWAFGRDVSGVRMHLRLLRRLGGLQVVAEVVLKPLGVVLQRACRLRRRKVVRTNKQLEVRSCLLDRKC